MQGQSPQQQLRASGLCTCSWSFCPGGKPACVLRPDHVWAWRLDPAGTEDCFPGDQLGDQTSC